MRIDEIELVGLNDVLNSDQYLKLLQRLKTGTIDNIDVTHIKNQIIQSWKKGMKSRKHYDNLLQSVDLNIHDLIK